MSVASDEENDYTEKVKPKRRVYKGAHEVKTEIVANKDCNKQCQKLKKHLEAVIRRGEISTPAGVTRLIDKAFTGSDFDFPSIVFNEIMKRAPYYDQVINRGKLLFMKWACESPDIKLNEKADLLEFDLTRTLEIDDEDEFLFQARNLMRMRHLKNGARFLVCAVIMHMPDGTMPDGAVKQ